MVATLLAYMIAAPLAILPLRLQNLLGAWLGSLGFWLLPRRREIAETNLGVAFPELTETERTALARSHFRHLGCFTLDFLQQPMFRFDWIRRRKIHLVNGHLMQEAAANGQAVILLCTHHGNWEACGILADLPDIELIAVYKQAKGFLDEYLYRLRQAWDYHLVSKRKAPRELVWGVRRGAVLGLIADQGGLAEYDFFGRAARFPPGPGHFWGKYGLPVVGATALRMPDGSYEVRCYRFDLPEVESIPKQDRARLITETYIQALEEWIRRHPEQYYWVHDIWRIFKHD